MNARELLADARRGKADDEFFSQDGWDVVIAALELKAAADANDGSTPETDAFGNRPLDVSLSECIAEWVDFARLLERERNGLAARVAELEKDEARLRFIADEPLFDQLGEIDLHEEAAINASAFGRDEPNSNDYLAAIRTAIDAQRKEGA